MVLSQAEMHRTIIRCSWRSIWELSPGAVLTKGVKISGRCMVETFHSASGLSGSVTYDCRGGSIANSLGLQIVNSLQLGHRNQASHLLSELTAVRPEVHTDDIARILDYCARSPDPSFVMETWRVLEEKHIGLSQKCYMLIIHALCNGGYMEEAVHLVKFLGENHRISFILPLYNYLLSACAGMEDVMHVNQCLDIMDDQLLGKNEVTYIALLKLAVWQKNLSAAHDIWKEYSKHYNMNLLSLRRFIWTFTRLKDLESAYMLLQHMVSLAAKEDTVLYRTNKGKIRCPHLDIPIPSMGGMSVMDFHQKEDGFARNTSKALQGDMDNRGRTTRIRLLDENKMGLIKKVLRWSFNDVIHACAQCGNDELAEQLIMQMQNLGLEPSSHTYDALIKAVIPGREIDDIIEVLKVTHERDLKLYDSTLSTLSLSCSRALDLDLAEALLNQIDETCYAYPYNAFLAACDTLDKPERAVKMLAKMRALKIKPDIRTYELLFSLFGNVNAPYEEGNLFSQADVTKRIKALEIDMFSNGIRHSYVSVKNLLKALGIEGMVQDMLQYLRAAEEQMSQHSFLGTEIYNIVLHSLIEAKEDHLAIEMFRKMKLCGFQPDAATYNVMIDCCSNIRCFKSACALVSLMLRDGFCPQTLTYTALIKILLEFDAFDEALNLLDRAIFEGNKLDVLLFNTILLKAGLQRRVDVIEFVLEVMHREKIQPDPSTCSYVFTAYVNRNFLGTAIEALQVLSMRMISQDDTTLEDVRREYEHLILTEEPEAELQIMRIFRNSENLAAALLNLRWCSIAGSSISWVPDQSQWAKRLTSSYDTH